MPEEQKKEKPHIIYKALKNYLVKSCKSLAP